jgi:hypothetical protein
VAHGQRAYFVPCAFKLYFQDEHCPHSFDDIEEKTFRSAHTFKERIRCEFPFVSVLELIPSSWIILEELIAKEFHSFYGT